MELTHYDPNGEYYLYKMWSTYRRFHWFSGVQCIENNRQDWHFEQWWDGVGKPDESKAKSFLKFMNDNADRIEAKEGQTTIAGEVTARWIHIYPRKEILNGN